MSVVGNVRGKSSGGRTCFYIRGCLVRRFKDTHGAGNLCGLGDMLWWAAVLARGLFKS